ncbi:MAG: zinc metalloprotease HtpX [Acidaminococcus sp.]|jgi:heat shock protein HtpX|nr:zinc metalloprotease HtpX [Acidaminococcus sp.]MCI2116015.1 zinc metalloprotease HtpX [Acidaminococcus sp.]
MLKTTLLMGLMTALLLVIGDYVGGTNGMAVMLLISILSNMFIYWNSDKIVISQYGAQEVNKEMAPGLWNIVEALTRRAGLPMPRVCIIDSRVPNAFATGRNPEHAAVCVTTGLMDILTPRELSGVLGHELSHIRHNDILIGTIAAGMAGLISYLSRFLLFFGGRRDRDDGGGLGGLFLVVLTPLMAAIIQLAVSRTREYMADESGGELCGDPDALADALAKIESIQSVHTMPNATENTAHLFIISPFSARDAKALFSTHPATEDRIERLRKQAAAMRAAGKIDPVA